MSKKTIVIVIFFVIAMGVGGYFIWKKLQDDKDDDAGEEVTDKGDGKAPVAPTILASVKANLGSGKLFTNALETTWNGNKYKALFYTNGRIIIFDNSTDKVIRRGTFSNGGKTLIMDNGVTAESGSVWANLANAIK